MCPGMFPMKAQYPNFYSVEKSQCNKFKEIKQEVAFGPYEGGHWIGSAGTNRSWKKDSQILNLRKEGTP